MEREKEVLAAHDDGERAGAAEPREPLLGAKLRRGLAVAKRGGPCTPVCAWKLEEDVDEAGPSSWADNSAETAAGACQNGARAQRRHRHGVLLAFPAAVSARELGARFWEVQDPPRYGVGRRSARGLRRRRDEKVADPSNGSPLGHRKQVAASNLATTPTNSLDLKGRSGCGRKTSTELLKVLSRIWTLEERHTSTESLVKKLKLELENAQAHIQQLLQEKQSNHDEIDNLMKQIAEDKLARKSKEQERIRATVKSLRAELEDERRLRRHSESLHQRLVKELSETKSAFSMMMRDLEGEKKARNLLEDLCDEFAKGIKEYEEVRELKPESEGRPGNSLNSLMFDFSEAWLEERLQIKLAEIQGDLSEKNEMMEKLGCEVGAFLQERRLYSLNDDVLVQKGVKDRCLRRHSLESIYLNGAASAPQYADDEDSVASDLHCFELNMGTNTTERHDSLKHDGVQHMEKLDAARNSNVTKKMVGSSERLKYQGSSSSQMKFDGHTQSCNDVKGQFMNKIQGIHRRRISGGKDTNHEVDVFSCQKLEEHEAREDAQGIEAKLDGSHTLARVFDNAVIESEFVEFRKHHSEGNHTEEPSDDLYQHPSIAVGRDDISGDYDALSSPVHRWRYDHLSPDPQKPECSKLPHSIKESTLKAKLLQARLEGQHARLKTSRDSTVGA